MGDEQTAESEGQRTMSDAQGAKSGETFPARGPSPLVRVSDIGTKPGRLGRILKKLLLLLTSVLFTLALMEIGVRIFESKIRHTQIHGGWFSQVETLSDPKLGKRVVANPPGHDANGFRNATVRERSEVVALGDSQTWGQNVPITEAWPQVLEKTTGKTVYNMGMAGYGPIEYSMLAPDALKLSPRVVVVGIYFGNDLAEAYGAVYSREAFVDLRNPSAAQPGDQDQIVERASVTVNEVNALAEEIRRKSTPSWLLWLGAHSAVGRELSFSGRWPGSTSSASNAALRKAIEQHPAYGLVYDSEHSHTILETSYRLAALDRNEPQILEGLRLTKLSLDRIQELTSKTGTKLIVLLIPTKEFVYASKAASLGRVDFIYAELIKIETADRDEIENHCLERSIQVADSLPGLREAVERDEQIYPETNDGHPNWAGYRLIAETVKAQL